MRAPIVLGVDLGTQQLKVIAFDVGRARVVGTVQSPVHSRRPAPGRLEQVPQEWWTALCGLTRRLLDELALPAEAVAAIGLSGHMHSIVPLRADGSVAHHCIVWADTRSQPQAERIGRQVSTRLWNPPIAPYSIAKILWLREHRPEIHAQVRHYIFSKDYLRYRMTGRIASDYSDASATLMWDFKARAWDAALLGELDVALDYFPAVQESAAVAGELTAAAANELGLPRGTPVVHGGGDAACAVVGAGIADSDTLLINAGTAVQVIEIQPQPMPFDPQAVIRYLFELGIDGKSVAIGALNSAGQSLEWWRGFLDARLSYAELDALAAEAASLPGGPLFLPYLQGTGTPYLRDEAFGTFVQLSATADRRTLTRAVMDGVAFGIRHCAEALVDAESLAERRILITGGLPKSRLMRHILTNVLGGSLTFRAFSDMSALGAVAFAAVGAGLAADVPSFLAGFDYGETRAAASPPLQAQYAETYERYKAWAEQVASISKNPKNPKI